MNRFSFTRKTNRTLARSLRLTTLTLLGIMLGLLMPLFAPAAQAATSSNIVFWGTGYPITLPVGLDTVTAMAGAFDHYLALKSDGTVAAWGNSAYGQTTVPIGLSSVIAVGAGNTHSLALKSDGTVVAWGDNRYGQRNMPAGLSNVIAISAGYNHNLALKSDGTVVAWGDNTYRQATVPAGLSNVVAIAAGDYHSLAVKRDGTVVAWGDNSYRQAAVPAGLSNVIAVAAGTEHSLALKSDGTVVAWGTNESGQTSVPAGLTNVTAIFAIFRHNLALKRDGTVVIWGSNEYGLSNVPAGLANIIAIAGGNGTSFAVRKFDTIAPVTTLAVAPAAPNASGWYTSDVQLRTNASDATPSAGIAETRCVLDPAAVPASFAALPSGCAYTGAAAAITNDGRHRLFFASSDRAGNQGPVRSFTINIDKSAPVLSASVSQTTPSASATVTLTATDSLSGVAATNYTINGGAPQAYTAPFSFDAAGSYQISYSSVDNAGNTAPAQSLSVTIAPPTITPSAGVQVISTPPSVVENVLESDQYIRVFIERQNYTLPQALTLDAQGAPGTIIPAGTKVNVYYIHADRVGSSADVVKKLAGSVTFDTKVLAAVSSSTALASSHSALGSPTTTYSTNPDQGIEYGDSVTVNAQQNQITFAFDLWTGADDVRVITLAP